MKYLIMLFVVMVSFNLFASDGLYIDLGDNIVSAETSSISIQSKLNSQYFLHIKYLNTNSVSPLDYGKSREMKLFEANQCTKMKFTDKILYQNIYKNVDLTVYKKDNSLKYDFIVYPKGNPNNIQIELSDETKLIEGDLHFGSFNILKELKPDTYQIVDGNKKVVKSKFALNGNVLSFEVGEYNRSLPLVIDPELVFSSLLGGDHQDYSGHLAKDSKGNIYFAFQTETSFLVNDEAINNKSNSNRSICVLKYDINMEIQWGLYLGSNGTSHVMDIKCDHDDNIWLGGETNSSSFPVTANAPRTYLSGYFDMILTKLSSDGDLLFSTLYGGNAYDVIAELDIDSKNNVWATGRSSGGFPITQGATPYSGDYDGFIFGLSDNGDLLLSTFLGTSGSDIAEGFAVDSEDNIYVSGHTFSNYFITYGKNSNQYIGSRDAFLLKYSTNNGIIWSTYYGGEDNDWGSNLEIDNFDNIYMSGYTSSKLLPNLISSVQDGYGGNYDMYLAKFDTEGKNIWSTYYGGSFSEGFETTNDMYGGLDIFTNGDILLGGRTKSGNIPMFGSEFNKFGGNQDGVVLLLSSDGLPKWSAYIGGSNYEENMDVLFDSFGNIICSGNTTSINFPVTENTFYNTKHDGTDAYIVRFGNPCHQSAFELGAEPVSNFAFNGNAAYDNDTLVMHPQTSYLEGSVWYNKLMPINIGFVSEFKFRMTRNDNIQNVIEDPGAAEGGLAFVIQNSSSMALGETDFGIGYQGIPNGIAIEFDTYKNDEDSYNDQNDPSDGHIAVMGMSGGALLSHHDAQKTFANVELKDDSTVYHCKVKYDGVQQKLTIYFAEDGQALKEVISLTIDLSLSIDLKDDAWAYLGFTAANGSVAQTHDIFDWTVCPSPDSPDTGIEDYAGSESNVFIFPNPTNDNITIHYAPEKMSYTNISLYDVAGRKLALLYSGLDNPGEQTISMPLPADLIPGVYMIELNYGYARESVKVIVK